MKTLLSTKVLSSSQKELLLNSGLSFVEYDAIKIRFLAVDLPQPAGKGIVTSQNAAIFLLNNNVKVSEYFCVGEKTSALLIENGQNVIKTAKNAKELADFISKSYKTDLFYFFCGNRRTDDIPNGLNEVNIPYKEIVCYETILHVKTFQQKWDGILFFSPSGVESYISTNKFDSAAAFCIGETTGSEAKKYTNNTVIANSTSIESVIAKAVKTLSAND